MDEMPTLPGDFQASLDRSYEDLIAGRTVDAKPVFAAMRGRARQRIEAANRAI